MPKPNAQIIKEAEDELRELKNWLFVFAKEYNLPEEAVEKLHEKIDAIAEKLADVE